MKVAIIGAGLSGLAACYYLTSLGVEVTLFDRKGIGAGASGVAAGLLHPCPAKEGRRSLYADEAMQESRNLLLLAEKSLGQQVAQFGGFNRIKDPKGWVQEGIVVWVDRYLRGLFLACKNINLIIADIVSPPEGYDHVIFANGAGIKSFFPDLAVSYVKGQAIECEKDPNLSTFLGDGYVVQHPNKTIIGSSFERDYENDQPNLEAALNYLKPRLSQHVQFDQLKILNCSSAIRVCRRGSYLPIIEQVNKGTWIFTALGSRGLLYHALYAKKLANALVMSET